MRLARWLAQLRQRPRLARRQGVQIHRVERWPIAEVELLEDRTQLTALTYSATNVPLQLLPGNSGGPGTTISTIHVPDDLIVHDVNAQINIAHPDDRNFLSIDLIAPGGTRLEIFRSGISVIGLGNVFSEVTLGEQAGTFSLSAYARFRGNFLPTADSTLLDGQQTLGDWKLEIEEPSRSNVTGTLLSWSLTIQGLSVDRSTDVILPLASFQSGNLTLLIRNGDGSRFNGDVALFSFDGRMLSQQRFEEPSDKVSTFTETIAANDYFVRIRPASPTVMGAPLMELQFELASDLRDGGIPKSLHLVDVNEDGQLDVVTLNSGGVLDVSVFLGQENGTFTDAASFGLGDSRDESRTLQVIDVDRDGHLDLMTTFRKYDFDLRAYVGGYVRVGLGRGNGTFSFGPKFAVGESPILAQVIDVNGDDHLDVVTSSQNVSVLIGHGDGTFEVQRTYDVGGFPHTVQFADLNEDSRLDMVTANFGSTDISVLLGQGDDTFAGQQPFALGETVNTLQIVDLDQDGHLDLVTSNRGEFDEAVNALVNSHVSVLLGRGNGTFADRKSFAVGGELRSVQLIDLNGDSRLDLAALNSEFNEVVVLLGQGNGNFAAQQRFGVGSSPSSLKVADFNSDGRLDLATSNFFSDDVSVLLGRGDGTFADEQSLAVGVEVNPISVHVVDANGDGRLDLVTANQGRFDPVRFFFLGEGLSVLLGRGDGTFAVQRTFDVGEYASSIQVIDVNGDGRLDLVTANRGRYDRDRRSFVGGNVSVLLGRGDGTLTDQQTFDVGENPLAVQAIDVNEDGRLDLVTVNQGRFDFDRLDFVGDGVSVLLGKGDGTFADQRTLGVGDFPSSVQVVDVNQDGALDLVTSNYSSGNVSVRLGRGDGTFAAQRTSAVGGVPISVQVVDVNGDGSLDLVTIGPDNFDFELQTHVDGQVSVLLGRGNGTFGRQQSFAIGAVPNSAQIVDVSGDGHFDLVIALERSNNVLVMRGRGDGTFGDQQSFVVGGVPRAIQVVDVNVDGLLDLVVPNSDLSDGSVTDSDHVSVLLGRPDGTFADQQAYTVGDGPTSVLVIDVNGDDRLDFVVSNNLSNSVSVLLSQGGGQFGAQQTFAVGREPFLVRATDLNGDGRLDLVTQNSFDASILLGDGSGNFVNALGVAPISVGTRPVVDDINGDAIDDVLVLRLDGTLLYRQGARTVDVTGTSKLVLGTAVEINPENPARDFTVLRTASGLRIAALDRTGDAVSLHELQTSATGAMLTFPRTRIPINTSLAARIVAGKFDQTNSHGADFALINQGTQTVTLYLADETGFQPTVTFDAGAGPVSLTTTDLNKDGLTDIVVPNFGSGDVSVFTNSGEGHFETSLFRTGPGPYFIGPSPYDASRLESQSFDQTSSAEVGDFNGDGLPDVIATNPGSNSFAILFGAEGGTSLTIGKGVEGDGESYAHALPDGQGVPPNFADAQITLLGNSPSRFAAVRVADVDLDGHDDAVFLNESGTQFSVFLGSRTRQSSDRSLTTSATGSSAAGAALTLVTTIDLPTPLTGFSLHDADGDARPDVFATNEFGDLLLLLNRGEGRFEEDRQGDRSTGLAVLDFDLNNDGQRDAVVTSQASDDVSIRTAGTGDALEEVASSDDGVLAPGTPKLADLDGDGVADLIVPNTRGNSVVISKGRRDGTFGTGETIFTGSNPASVTVSDLDGDRRLDLIVTNRGSNTVAVFYGQAAVDAQTIDGTNALPFRAGALSRLPSGSGPVDAQVVSLPKADGSMQTGLVVTNSTSNSVSFIPSAGNGIFNATPSNEVPLGFSPLPGAIVNGNLVLPNPAGNSLASLSLSASLFATDQPIQFAQGAFNSPIGLDGSVDFNSDGFFDLFVANNGDGSVSLLFGDANGFDFFQSFLLDGITHASDLQVAGFQLYVTEEGQEFFTVFDLANLTLGPIPSFEQISGDSVNPAAGTNPPNSGIGGLSGALLFAFFGTLLPEDGEASADEIGDVDPASWRSFVWIVSQVTQQIERIADELLDALTNTRGIHWSRALEEAQESEAGIRFLTGAAPESSGLGTLDILLTPLGLLTGTQPLTQLVRGLRSLWPNRTSVPSNRPAESSTSPATKTPLKNSEKPGTGKSSAIPDRSRNRSREASVRTLTSSATSGTSAVPPTQFVWRAELAEYMTQIGTNPTVASELFDRRWQSPPEAEFDATEDHFGVESATGWRSYAWSAVVSPAFAELARRRDAVKHFCSRIRQNSESSSDSTEV